MLLHSDLKRSPESDCPYLKEKKWRTDYFFASGLTGDELEELLSRGWRKFGIYYFRPSCLDCEECVPIRLLTSDIRLSKSMKRVLRKGGDIEVFFHEPEYRDEIFQMYQKHSHVRFEKTSSHSDFMHSFYMPSCPGLQSEYFLDGILVAVGFLDISSAALSSIYFIYDTDYSEYSLGTLSVIKEAQYAASLGLPYYYLGYYVKDNSSMSYKNSFHRNEKMDWKTGEWIIEED